MRRVTGVLVLALLAGCSGDGGGSDYGTPFDIAAKLGCEATYDEEAGAIAPADVGTCQYGGEQVTLVVGSEDEVAATEKLATDIAEQFGAGASGTVVDGGGWAVMTETATVARAAQGEVGGSVQ